MALVLPEHCGPPQRTRAKSAPNIFLSASPDAFLATYPQHAVALDNLRTALDEQEHALAVGEARDEELGEGGDLPLELLFVTIVLSFNFFRFFSSSPIQKCQVGKTPKSQPQELTEPSSLHNTELQ